MQTLSRLMSEHVRTPMRAAMANRQDVPAPLQARTNPQEVDDGVQMVTFVAAFGRTADPLDDTRSARTLVVDPSRIAVDIDADAPSSVQEPAETHVSLVATSVTDSAVTETRLGSLNEYEPSSPSRDPSSPVTRVLASPVVQEARRCTVAQEDVTVAFEMSYGKSSMEVSALQPVGGQGAAWAGAGSARLMRTKAVRDHDFIVVKVLRSIMRLYNGCF
jgi:hypothetical protein